jgi:tungstate transport system permease protein
MNDFAAAFQKAFSLIGSFDPELRLIVFLSLEISLTASACALAHRSERHWPCIASGDAAR